MALRLGACLLACVLALGLAGCGRLAEPKASGELVIGIRNGPSSYEIDGEGNEAKTPKGFEYDMVEAFAREMGVKTRYVEAADQDELHGLLRKGKVHFAAACFAGAQDEFLSSPPLRETQPVLVAALDEEPDEPWNVADLAGKKVIALNASPQLGLLQQLAGTPPSFRIETRKGAEFDLIREVSDDKADLAATDSLQYALALHFEPNLQTVMTLPGKVQIGWCFHREDEALWAQAKAFIESAQQNGTLARIRDRYFGNLTRVGHDEITEFFSEMRTTLPPLRKRFQDAQAATGIDWRLLAALAYQESRWDPQATSPTGVRGIMMLTEDTADRLGVGNRLDPGQSIRAGARYLADLRDQLPADIPEPDRTWLALAGYNLGQGHLNGARAIAESMKRDARSWYEMKAILPLMARPEIYRRLKSGRARGGEAVIMVENIRTYYGILSHFETPLPTSLSTGGSKGFGLKLK